MTATDTQIVPINEVGNEIQTVKAAPMTVGSLLKGAKAIPRPSLTPQSHRQASPSSAP